MVESEFNTVIRQKIILIGNVTVGKTSIINYITNQKFAEEYEPSIGVDFYSKPIKYKGKEIKLQFWDTAGQERFKSLIPNYVRGASMVFLIYDITNIQSFKDVPKWVSFIREIEDTKIILVGNKIDLIDKRIVTFEDGQKMANENKLTSFYEISVKEEKNITNMIYGSISELPVFMNISDRNSKEEIINDLAVENSEQNKTNTNNTEPSGVINININNNLKCINENNNSNILNKDQGETNKSIGHEYSGNKIENSSVMQTKEGNNKKCAC